MQSNTRDSESMLNTAAVTWWQRHSRRVWLAVRLVAALLALAAAGWWFLLSPVAVTTHTVAVGTVSAEVLGTGTLEARTSALVGPKVAGLISRVSVDQGDRVKAGDTLVYLEDIDFKQQVAVAEADVAAAVAGIDRLYADQLRAEAVLAQARLGYERIAQTAAARASSQQELDKAAEALAIAEAELSRAGTAIVEGQRRHAAAERSVDFQRARLNDTTIEAPFDALVVRRDREAGDVVTAGSSVLFLVSLAEMWVTAWVDETELARLADEQPARVVFRSEASTEYPGVVARVGREADRETREIVVDVHVKQLPANWAIGQRAEVYILTDRRENVVFLPAGLVLLREGKHGVIVEEGSKARWRDITLGLRGREVVEVVSGLSAGDVVVSPRDANSGPIRIGRRISP